MDRKEKAEKKKVISERLDLSNQRFRDDEVDRLYDLTTHENGYDGKSKTFRNSFDGWYSGGKYTRTEENTYTIRDDDDGFRIDHHYESHDDDGEEHFSDGVLNTGRAVLDLFSTLSDLFK